MAAPAVIDIAALRRAVAGDVIVPPDAGYDTARAVWNAAIDRRPAAILRCTGTEDVVEGLAFARAAGVRVAVRGGGHNIAGLAVCDDGLVLDLSLLRGATVDAGAGVAQVRPGSTWGDVDAATQAVGLAAPGGIVSTTGVAGFTLGGGIGWLTRPCGPACDSLIGAEVVTADGAVVETDLAGAFGRVDEDAAAFAHRSAPLMLNVNARWEHPSEAECNIAWARDAWEALASCSAGGVYVNFLGEEGADRVRAAYGDAKYARLAELKRRYDPDNVFRVNQNIAPASGRGRFDRAQLGGRTLGGG
jgi:FAD/FMN-containing dehydrogenase